MSSFPCLVRTVSGAGEVRYSLGHRLVDRYLEFVAGRARPNTLRAVAFDLKSFFTVVAKEPAEVTAADVFDFLAEQRGDRSVVRLADRESGLSARTIARRLSSVSGLYAYLIARGIRRCRPARCRVAWPPGARAGRGSRAWCRWCGCRGRCRGSWRRRRWTGWSLRCARTRDRAMVLAMVLAGLRRCEVLGLRMADVRAGDRRLFVAEGKGGHQRVIPVANGFLRALGDYLHDERPAASSTDRVFVVLKGPRRGQPLSAEGLDEILAGARWRSGLEHATCHELRHTCLTRLREAGMALEAVQAQAGQRSIESTRIYLHLTNDWLAGEYRRAAALTDADQAAVAAMVAVQEVIGQ
jgi:integrase/recombinase XerD